MKSEEIKQMVKEKYSAIALQEEGDTSSCCGATCSSDEIYNIMTDDYTGVEGYHKEADLALGCGLPVQFAKIKKGDVVLDLGSGAGNDCFVARAETGAEGKVIGVDMTEAMIERARANAEKLGYNNVEFRLGDIEHLPLTKESVNVIVSNCVLNLVPDKPKAFSEMFRVLKAGGHFSVSDIVLKDELPAELLTVAEMYAGCISGAVLLDDYLNMIKDAGFENIIVQKQKKVIVPDDILEKYLNADAVQKFKSVGEGILSITVFAEKTKSCCDGNCCS